MRHHRGAARAWSGLAVCQVSIEIGDPRGERYERVDATVDTGPTYTVALASKLRGLGIEPRDRAPFELADGSMRDYDVGQTMARVDGREVTALVVFGDDDVGPLLGAYTLEGLRMAADPVRRRLVSVPGRLI